jgi:hypothetical protein
MNVGTPDSTASYKTTPGDAITRSTSTWKARFQVCGFAVWRLNSIAQNCLGSWTADLAPINGARAARAVFAADEVTDMI